MSAMSKWERAKEIAKNENLPEWQNEYLGTVADQLLTIGLNFYETNMRRVLGDGVPLITMTPDQATEQAKNYGKILLCFALDVCHILDELQKKENGEEKRDIPPTPPIESKGEEKEKDPHTTRAREEGYPEFFKEFWDRYPVGRKVNKKTVYRNFRSHWKAAKDKEAFQKMVLEGLDRWIACQRWKEGIICNPLTWVNQERWLASPDENITTPTQTRKARGVSQTANVISKEAKGLW